MTIYLVGSGPADTLDSVHDQFVASAKKRGPRIAVALLGSEEEVGQHLAGYTDPITSRWPEAEIVPVWLDDETSDEQNRTVWPDDPESLAGFVVAGGWTPGYLDALREHRELIAKLVRRGVPYLGYSAGAMIVGRRAIVGGWKFRGRQVQPELWGEGLEELELRDGLGLIGPSVDVHSDVTGLGAGLAALEKGEVTTVVAIDEGTCLVVDPVSGRTGVEGAQRIHWLTKEGHAVVVHHESSEAEKQRQEGYRASEKEMAEREAASRAALEAKLAEKRRIREQEAAERRAADEAAAAERQRILDEERARARKEHDAMVAAEKLRREAEEAERRVEQEAREAEEKAAAQEKAARDAEQAERDAEQAEQRRAEQREQRLRQTEERRAASALRAAERAAVVEAAERAAALAAALEGESGYLEDEPHRMDEDNDGEFVPFFPTDEPAHDEPQDDEPETTDPEMTEPETANPKDTDDQGLLEPFDGLPGGPVETTTDEPALAPGTDTDPAPEQPEVPQA